MRPTETTGGQVPCSGFPTTQWTVVLEAGALAETEADPDARARSHVQAQAALECLCSRYRAPLLAYLIAEGDTPSDAEDRVQEFLVHLIEPGRLQGLDGDKGRFRTWLLRCLTHHVRDNVRYRKAQKRGGGRAHTPWDTVKDEVAPGRGVADQRDTPAVAYDRSWAQNVLKHAWSRLRGEYARQGKQRWFELFEPVLYGDAAAAPHREIARQIGLSESGARSAVSRARSYLRELIRDEVGRTLSVPSASEIEDELGYLVRLLSGDRSGP